MERRRIPLGCVGCTFIHKLGHQRLSGTYVSILKFPTICLLGTEYQRPLSASYIQKLLDAMQRVL